MANMLDDQMQGKIDSWAIRWCYAQSKLEMPMAVRHEVAQEMREDPSKPTCRSRFQTTLSCCSQKLW